MIAAMNEHSQLVWSLTFIGFATLSIFWTFVQWTAWYETRTYGAMLLTLISFMSTLVFGIFSLTVGLFRVLPPIATDYARVALLALLVLWVTYTAYYVRLIFRFRQLEHQHADAEHLMMEQQAEANELRIQLQEEEEGNNGLA